MYLKNNIAFLVANRNPCKSLRSSDFPGKDEVRYRQVTSEDTPGPGRSVDFRNASTCPIPCRLLHRRCGSPRDAETRDLHLPL